MLKPKIIIKNLIIYQNLLFLKMFFFHLNIDHTFLNKIKATKQHANITKFYILATYINY